MKKLQKSLSSNKGGEEQNQQGLSPKQHFEVCKKMLEANIKEVKLQLADERYQPQHVEDQEKKILEKELKTMTSLSKTQKAQLQQARETNDHLNSRIAEMEQLIGRQNEELEVLEAAQPLKQLVSQGTLTDAWPTPASQEERQRDDAKKMASNLEDARLQNSQLEHQVKIQEGALKNLREQNKALNAQLVSLKAKEMPVNKEADLPGLKNKLQVAEDTLASLQKELDQLKSSSAEKQQKLQDVIHTLKKDSEKKAASTGKLKEEMGKMIDDYNRQKEEVERLAKIAREHQTAREEAGKQLEQQKLDFRLKEEANAKTIQELQERLR